MRLGLRSLLLSLALAAPLAAAAPASAALPVGADASNPPVVTEVGTSDGIRAAGDTLQITQTIIASGPATSVVSTLVSNTQGVSVVQGSSPYPDLANGDSAANSVPFRVALDSLVPCGETIRLTLNLSGNQGTEQIPIEIATGAAGPYASATSVHVPRAIPVQGIVDSNLPMTGGGRAKGVRVHIDDLDHTYVGDLRISLIAPDGTSAIIFDRAGSTGDGITNASFVASGGADVGTLTPEYDGATINAPGLSVFDGVPVNGQWRLRVNDTKLSDSGILHAWSMDVSRATCDGRPVASFTASPNPVLPNQSVTLDASASTDPTDAITAYEWDLDGDGEYDDATGVTTTTQWATPRRVEVGLRITAGPDQDTVTVPVSVTGPPVARLVASTLTPATGETVTLDATTSSDPDGTIDRYEFDLDGDGQYERDAGANKTTTASWPSSGTREVRVRVTDNFGAQDTEAVTIVVANRPPTATLASTPTPSIAGAPTTLIATADDPDGDIVAHDWDVDGNGTYEAFTGENPSYSHTYATAGTYTARVRVIDGDGGYVIVSHQVVVTRAPLAALSASPSTASFGQVVTLNAGASSDPDGAPIASYEWDFDIDGVYDATTAGPTTTRSWDSAGVRTVRVRVTDAAGAKATATTAVTVRNLAPTPALSANPTNPLVGETVAFDAGGSSDPDGTVVGYQWDLDGDGAFEQNTGGAPTATHSYPNAGAVRVRVRAVDEDGGTAVKAVDLVVRTPAGTDPTGTGTGTTPTGTTGTTGGTSGGTTPGGTVEPAGEEEPGGPGGDGLTASLGGSPMQRLKGVAKAGLKLSCTASFEGRCVLEAFIAKADARRLRLNRRARKDVRVGRASVLLTPGRPAALKLRLSAPARAAIKRGKRVRVIVRGFARDGSSRSVDVSRVVLVRR